MAQAEKIDIVTTWDVPGKAPDPEFSPEVRYFGAGWGRPVLLPWGSGGVPGSRIDLLRHNGSLDQT